jgi:apolipoprotein N-acyltransferase
MLKLADAVVLSSGWPRRLIAFVTGAFGALALAPVNFAPAFIVPMVAAVWLLDGASGEKGEGRRALAGFDALRLAFGTGWWLGFGFFIGGLWWLGAAFLLVPDYAWALPLGVIGVPALLALFTGVGFVIARLLWSPGPARILALALGLAAAEWARGHLFTGFPWNDFGMVLGSHLMSAQAAALVGLDGLTLLSVALCAAPATLCDTATGRLAWKGTIVALLTLAGILVYGALRLTKTPPSDTASVIVRIMQPGPIPNDEFVPENKDRIVQSYIALSQRDDTVKNVKLADVTLLIWPESAFPFILTRDPDSLTKIGAFLPSKTTLVTGAAREEELPSNGNRRPYSVYFNSIEAIRSGGMIIDSYDKEHLVPFGEYLPFDRILRWLGLRHFVSVPGGFEPGHVRHALVVPDVPPMIPLLCYEAIFSGEVGLSGHDATSRPRVLLNLTNDGWFGLTAGPYQHFAEARLRTIEEGLPMLRGAATGISAILDPYGRVREQLALGATDILDGALPGAIAPPPFARAPNLMLWTLWAATLALLFVLRWTARITLPPERQMASSRTDRT